MFAIENYTLFRNDVRMVNNNIYSLVIFNVNWNSIIERRPLCNLFIQDHRYGQMVSFHTTTNKTCINHIFANFQHIKVLILETYFTDHKSVCAPINSFSVT